MTVSLSLVQALIFFSILVWDIAHDDAGIE